MNNIKLENVEEAKRRIEKYINKTPVIFSETLNNFLGHQVFFKAENLQKIGAFKIRGGLNAVAWLIENNLAPKHIVANSSGNHAQAIALASNIFHIPSTIFMPKNASKVKVQATLAYGAEIDFSENRVIADQKVEDASKEKDTYWIHPFNNEQVICGQGTAAYEGLSELKDIDAVFAPCGGGGLLSGTFIAARGLSKKTKIMGVEPKLANDAVRSVKKGEIVRLDEPPNTIADGARTMSVGDITFQFLKRLDEFYEADEKDIIYWTQWLTHLLKVQTEPTSAMAMSGVSEWLKHQKTKKRVLVILSGGNIDKDTMNKIWSKNFLSMIPSVNW